MNSKENPFDKIMKSKMENYEVLPDEDFWDNIESTMVRKKNMFYIRGILLISSIILIAFFVFKRYSATDAVKSEAPEKTIKSTTMPEGALEKSSEDQQSLAVPVNKKNKFAEVASAQAEISTIDSIKNVPAMEGNKDYSSINAVTVADTVNTKTLATQNNMPKKVVKKPVYIIKQDTIYKVDTLKTKKKKNN